VSNIIITHIQGRVARWLVFHRPGRYFWFRGGR